MTQPCKICGTRMLLFDVAKILGKYDIAYYECPACGFIQTEEPYWLNEAYSDAITSSDIGLIGRNVMLSNAADVFLGVILRGKKTFLDYGGGYGIFVRLMRDRGYSFEWYDEYCKNLFAKGHEMRLEHYDVVTSFEMLEHLSTPMQTLGKIFSLGDTLICTTALVPASRPKVDDWWYYGTDHGQHIAFYTEKAMEHIAREFGKKYYDMGPFHIFTATPIPSAARFLFRHEKARRLCRLFAGGRPSLLGNDYFAITGKTAVTCR